MNMWNDLPPYYSMYGICRKKTPRFNILLVAYPNLWRKRWNLTTQEQWMMRREKLVYVISKWNRKNEGSKGGLGRRGRILLPNRQTKATNGRNVQQWPFSKFPVRNQSKVPTSTENRQSEGINKSVNDQQHKQPMQCWGCREPIITKTSCIRSKHDNFQTCKKLPWLGRWQGICPELMLHLTTITQVLAHHDWVWRYDP